MTFAIHLNPVGHKNAETFFQFIWNCSSPGVEVKLSQVQIRMISETALRAQKIF